MQPVGMGAVTPDKFFVKALGQLRAEEYRQAWVSLRRAVAGYEAVEGTGRQRARCHHALGSVFLHLGNLDAAVSEFSESLALLEGVGDSDLDRAHSLLFLGIALAEAGRGSAAATALRSASSLFQTHGGDQQRVTVCQAHLDRIDPRDGVPLIQASGPHT